MDQKKYPPPPDSDATRQVEMLLLGISLADTLRSQPKEPEAAAPKARTLDDMRRLSRHIKKVPVYTPK
jgi:hypothetical protein